MRLRIAAALALLGAGSLHAQTAAPIPDLTTFTPIAGDWSYASSSDGSDATFANSSGSPQLRVHCVRSLRQVSISRPAGAPAPVMNVWTSSASRSVVSSFDPATRRLTIVFGNTDPLLDAIANSRGRLGFAIGSDPALIVPAWAEVSRVIEDCRI
jgi:hypothetical protein